ncbi:MAG TPA: DUF72 domain-containing protein [Nitrosopumilaceae archaeon]|nr:DUF72 domain-containing protein [Nitrosopumilaceae archaeon]
MEIKIGCTGWSYEGWIGPFYPSMLSQKDQLKYYSSIFDLTEINSTFYRIPTLSMTQKWFHDTPDNFTFTAKLPKIITHENRLKPGPYLDEFFQAIKPMKSKMKVIVIQLPPSLSFAEAKDRLEKMLNHLPKSYQYAVEGSGMIKLVLLNFENMSCGSLSNVICVLISSTCEYSKLGALTNFITQPSTCSKLCLAFSRISKSNSLGL